MNRRPALLAVAAGALVLATIAGCSNDDSGEGPDGRTEAACDPLPSKQPGVLTVATSEPAFEPWVVDDDPANGQGFEGAVVAAVAEELGIDEVTWIRTSVDEAVAPGEKDFDLSVQQHAITDELDEVMDLSDGYYRVEQAVVAAAGNPVARATSVADLADTRLGAVIDTRGLDIIQGVIEPATQPLAFPDFTTAKEAVDAGQVDGIVLDLPTAFFIAAVQAEGASIVGVLPQRGDAEELGFLFEEGSPLVACVNEALGALRSDGTIEALEEQWLRRGGEIPTLEP